MTYEDFGIQKQEGKLNNGMRVVLFQRSGAPLHIRAVLKAGSCTDPEGKEGLSHFLEHMMANGSAKFPTKDLLAEQIESVGGMYVLSTMSEIMTVSTEVADKEDIDNALGILEAAICEPLFDETKLESERTIILAEYGQMMSNPKNFLFINATGLIFKDTRFSFWPIGLPEGISSISMEDIKNHYRNLVHIDNMIIVASGDISLDTLLEKLNTLHFPTPENPSKEDIAVLNPSIENCDIHIPHESKQSYIFYGFKGGEMFSEDALSLKVLGVMLAGGRNSRFIKRLRYDLGLIYSIQQVRLGNLNSSVYGVMTNTASENVKTIVSELDTLFTDLAQNGVSEKELAFAKNKIIKSLRRNMQTSANWVDFHFYGELLDPEKYWSLDRYVSLIEKLTLPDIARVTKKYFVQENRYIVTIGQK